MKRLFSLTLISLLLTLSSCEVLNQLNQIQSFTKCEFRLKSVNQVKVAGVRVDNKNSWNELGFMNIAKITTALTKPEIPMDMNLNIEVKNPNNSTASMTQLEWILILDGIEMTKGFLYEKITIPANGGVNTLPLNISLDLRKALKGQSGDALLNFSKNLIGIKGKPSEVTLKVKPQMSVYGVAMEYPGYITLSQSFKAQ
jgi:hypothetical protein